MTKPPHALVAAFLLLALGATSGCSFKLMKPPPPPSEWPTSAHPTVEASSCTATLIPPLLDTAVTMVLVSAAVYERRWSDSSAWAILGASAVPVAISAGYGYFAGLECRRYQRRFAPP